MSPGLRSRVAAGALLIALGPLACGLIPGGPGSELGVDREREITDDVARQIRASAPLLNDPVLGAYLNELGQSLVRVTEPQPFLYRFGIIRDPTLNAFTIGGGYVYLNSGVIAKAGSVSELMGVLAHEIGHVRMRHIARRAEDQGITTLASLAAVAAVAIGGADPGLMVVTEALNVSLQLRNSREAEAEADREALDYLVRAGYAPDGMVRFFERILAASPGRAGGGVPSYLFTHPAVEDRIRGARTLISRMDRPADLIREDARLAQMQDRLALILSPVAGGSGLQARTRFDRSLTDPLLEQAEAARRAGDPDAADALLLRAEKREESDPRVALARAELARERGDRTAELRHLRRAYAIDPGVPLLQLRLGDTLRQLGSRGEAVFYLEQAATNPRAGSSLHARAEALLEDLPYPPLESSQLGGMPAVGRPTFPRGEQVEWSGETSDRFADREVRVRWFDPEGALQDEQILRGRALRSTLETEDAALGPWSIEVQVGDVLAARVDFELIAPGGAAGPP